jgi:hypothetical protein
MWEVLAHPEARDEVLSWVSEAAVPAIEALPGHVSSEVLTTTEGRVVVVSRWRNEPVNPETPASYLLAAPARSWDFNLVDR